MQGVVNSGFSFGEFTLDPRHRVLARGGENVPLKPKTLDLLLTLIENRGRVLSKNELLDRVWENQFVEENNLTVHVAMLRKALGEGKNDHRYIVTVSGKGYRFVADVAEANGSDILIESHKVSRIVVEEDFEPTTTDVQIAPRLVTKRQSNRSAMVALASVVALFVVAGGIYFLGRAGPRPARGFYQNPTVSQLTTNGKVGMATLSPDGKLFAYTIDDLGKKSLWLGYVDGGNHLQLREPSDAAYRSLTFSPDNKHLYYSLRDEKNPKAALMRMPTPGGLQEKVLDDVGTFSLSPDSREIAVARPSKDDDSKIAVSIAPLDGSQQRDIAVFNKKQWFSSATISWSRDKTKLAFAIVAEELPFHTDVAIFDTATGSVEKIKHEVLREVTRTAWLADGSGLIVTAVEMNSHSSVPHYQLFQLAYPSGEIHRITNDRSNYGESWHNDSGVSLSLSDDASALVSVEHRQMNNVWIADAENLSNQRQITFGSFGKYDGLWGLDWTPDGRLIYNTSDTESQFVAQMNVDGSEQKQITASGKVDSSLSVTADGKHIVFHSNRAPDFSIWRADIDGSNAKQMTSGGDAFMPTASPDGKWIYFKSYIGERRGWLCRVPFEGGEQECITDQETSVPSFSPDGRFIAAAYKTDKTRLAIFSAADHSIVRQIEIPKNASPFIGIKWKPDSRTFTVRDASSGYWNFPIDGDPYKLAGLPEERLYNFSWSRDGKWLAFTRGQEIRDVVILRTRLKTTLSSDKSIGKRLVAGYAELDDLRSGG
jgi:DNA-binding winged helix-turn-helix (wHTH) protein/Tol biopolymer transport system component